MNQTNRDISEGIEPLIGRKFPVLNDGFVRVVDYMGSDSAIVQAARVSYGKGTKSVNSDAGLINYLMRHRHTTPFEMCEIKLHIRIPMDALRQLIRHRTANVNEYSTRYSEAIDSVYKVGMGEWRKQSADNKQGSGEFFHYAEGIEFSRDQDNLIRISKEYYSKRINSGMAREQARKDLLLCTYSELYWKIDLHNLLHFLQLRMDNHAQYEIRQYAEVMGNIVKEWCPLAWKAFRYRQKAIVLSAAEQTALSAIITNVYGINEVEKLFDSKGEYQEFRDKLKSLAMIG